MEKKKIKTFMEKDDYKSAIKDIIIKSDKKNDKVVKELKALLLKYLELEENGKETLEKLKNYHLYFSFLESEKERAKEMALLIYKIFEGKINIKDYRKAEVLIAKALNDEKVNKRKAVFLLPYEDDRIKFGNVSFYFACNEKENALIFPNEIKNPCFFLDVVNIAFINGYEEIIAKINLMINYEKSKKINELLKDSLNVLKEITTIKKINGSKEFLKVGPIAYFNKEDQFYYVNQFIRGKSLTDKIEISEVEYKINVVPFSANETKKIKKHYYAIVIDSALGLKPFKINDDFANFFEQFYVKKIKENDVKFHVEILSDKVNVILENGQNISFRFSHVSHSVFRYNVYHTSPYKTYFDFMFLTNGLKNYEKLSTIKRLVDDIYVNIFFERIYETVKKRFFESFERTFESFTTTNQEFKYFFGITAFFAEFAGEKEREELLKFVYEKLIERLEKLKNKNISEIEEKKLQAINILFVEIINNLYVPFYKYLIDILFEEKYKKILAMGSFTGQKYYTPDIIKNEFLESIDKVLNDYTNDVEKQNNLFIRRLIRNFIKDLIDYVEKNKENKELNRVLAIIKKYEKTLVAMKWNDLVKRLNDTEKAINM